MRFVKGMTIIFVSLFIGELLALWLPLPLPGNILGMVVLFGGLKLQVIALEDVESAGDLLLDNLVLLFVPVGVGMMRYGGLFRAEIGSVLVVGIGGFLLLFVMVGKLLDYLGREGDYG